MAKNSAKSKGYRKAAKKKPYLTKKEITITVAVIVLIIVGLILFNTFYDDGSLKVADGVVVTEGENSIIVNGSASSRSPRYFKLGQVSEIEGYTMERVAVETDENRARYEYTNEDEAGIDTISVSGVNYTAKAMTDLVSGAFGDSETSEDVDEIREIEVDGKKVYCYSHLQRPAEDAEDQIYTRELIAHIEVNEKRSIEVLVVDQADAEEGLVATDALYETLDVALAAISYETK
ncbi:MAG: hypothetical protein MJ099_02800 [Clostridia bacterium]|nr:hypothetical protein [Clostridia bacterium]